MKLRNVVIFLVLMAMLVAPVAAQAKYTSPAVSADEKAMAAEKRPNMASPQVPSGAVKVTAALPEKVTWFTSKPGVWGSARAKQGGMYRTFTDEFPETFRTVGPNANNAMRPAFGNSPSLVEVNYETKEFLPALATDWAFGADKKTVYYKLNEKAKWSDGKPITSKDYLFMMTMMKSENLQDPWYNEYYTEQIVDLKAYGDFIVSVSYVAEMAPADLLLNTSLSPRPAHFYPDGITATFVDDYQWKVEPTAGPYVLDTFVKGESMLFKKVKGWWGYDYAYNKFRFNYDTIQYKVITGGNDIIKNYFYNGELETFAMIIPKLWADEALNEKVVKGYIDREYAFYIPLQGVQGIFFNTKFPVFSDVNVRQGMYYAINMKKMIDTDLRGEYALNHNIGVGHTFAGIDFDDNSIRKPGFDPVKAGALFDKGGYTIVGPDGIRKNAKGERLAFELIYGSPNHTSRISILKEEAKKAGVEINMKLMQQGSFTALREKKFEAYWGGMSTGIYDDYWEYFHSKNAAEPQTNNFWSFANPEMDKLLDAYRDEGDLKKKAELSKLIQRFVDKEALVMPHYYVPYYRAGTWKWLRFPGWLNSKFNDDFFEPHMPFNGYGGYFGYTWFDEGIRKEVLEAQKAGKEYEVRIYKNELFKAK